VASELPSPVEPAVAAAAWDVVGFEIWHERLRRRLAKPEAWEHAQRLVKGVHESLYLRQSADDDQTTEQANRRLRDAYREAAAAVGLEPPPW
jgi:hypothetical protein